MIEIALITLAVTLIILIAIGWRIVQALDTIAEVMLGNAKLEIKNKSDIK